MHLSLTQYVPILKGKMGELGALRVLDEEAWQAVTPLIEVLGISGAEGNQRTRAQFLRSANQLEQNIGLAHRFFLDTRLMPSAAIGTLSSVVAERGLQVIPVASLDADPAFKRSVSPLLRRGRGLCIRVAAEECEDAEQLTRRVTALLNVFRLEPRAVDLVIDCGAVGVRQIGALTIGLRALLPTLPFLTDWRSLILSAAAFPETLAGFSPAATSESPRADWRLWTALIGRGALPRLPSFSDYAIAHPDLVEFDPVKMSMSAALRYTAPSSWFVFKGRSVKREGYEQMRSICRAVSRHEAFAGATFSWGDDWIAQCAAGEVSVGNATVWRKVGTSHHLTFVARQLASLAAPSIGA